MNHAMWAALPKAARIVDEIKARAVVITGAGGHFSAGADINEFDEVYGTPDSIRAYNGTVRAGLAAVAAIPCPVIAAVEGACVGGGLALALHADLRFAAPKARFAVVPARLGLAYSYEDTARLVATVGGPTAKDIIFSARKIDADEALSIGLVDRIDDALGNAVLNYAESVAALSSASHAVGKKMVEAVLTGRAEPALHDMFEALFTGPDFEEGKAAFRQKRTPSF